MNSIQNFFLLSWLFFSSNLCIASTSLVGGYFPEPIEDILELWDNSPEIQAAEQALVLQGFKKDGKIESVYLPSDDIEFQGMKFVHYKFLLVQKFISKPGDLRNELIRTVAGIGNWGRRTSSTIKLISFKDFDTGIKIFEGISTTTRSPDIDQPSHLLSLPKQNNS